MERSVDRPLQLLRRSDAAHEETAGHAPARAGRLDRSAKRALDIIASAALLLVTAPLFGLVALLIVLESPGGVFYRCHRVGFRGRKLVMLKFRKMHATASGAALTLADDDRFTRIGRILAATKLDELPQVWNVLRGDMSLVGPRPEDERFVDLHRESYERILSVRPGMTGLSQLAFARESEILDPSDRVGFYVRALLPQKVDMDVLYATNRTLLLDTKILMWTAAAVILRRDVAVDRRTGRLGFRRRPK